jgi:hypothetical protein
MTKWDLDSDLRAANPVPEKRVRDIAVTQAEHDFVAAVVKNPQEVPAMRSSGRLGVGSPALALWVWLPAFFGFGEGSLTQGEKMRRMVGICLALAGIGAIALVASNAGADKPTPVVPQLSAEEAGVKPGVVGGEETTIQTPEGTVQEQVSPCIRSSTSGYSDAELENTEWCFYAPGNVPTGGNSSKRGGVEPHVVHVR